MPKRAHLYGDSGYQVYDKDHPHFDFPYTKPKGGELGEEEKEYNRGLSSYRVIVEHRIGRTKRFRILSDRHRNPRPKHHAKPSIVAGIVNMTAGSPACRDRASGRRAYRQRIRRDARLSQRAYSTPIHNSLLIALPSNLLNGMIADKTSSQPSPAKWRLMSRPFGSGRKAGALPDAGLRDRRRLRTGSHPVEIVCLDRSGVRYILVSQSMTVRDRFSLYMLITPRPSWFWTTPPCLSSAPPVKLISLLAAA